RMELIQLQRAVALEQGHQVAKDAQLGVLLHDGHVQVDRVRRRVGGVHHLQGVEVLLVGPGEDLDLTAGIARLEVVRPRLGPLAAAVCYNRAAPRAGAVARSEEGVSMVEGKGGTRGGVRRRTVLGAQARLALLPAGVALAACGAPGGTGAAPAVPAKPTGKIDF